MAFDQTTRNRLARFVSDARALLTEEFTRQLQNEYGLDPARGDVTPIDRLTALDDRRRETAKILRETLEYYLASLTPTLSQREREDNRVTLDRIVREQAFTVLNRLCALRMSEARGLVLESVAKGYQSKGFQLYARLAGSALGETGEAYRMYLFSLMDEFAVDLPVLFDRFSPQGRLFPREATLIKLLELINDPEIDALWAEDETIGWIYQYFNSKEERKAMREASQAPRNSRELAVRNQFFTPRYVVEFLTDNTLGRIWYEMTKGETALKDTCRYLVRRKHTFFLEEGQEAPEPFLPEQRHETDPDLAHEMWLPPNDQITDLNTIFLYGLTAGGYDYARKQWGIECGDLANEKLKQYHETGKWEGTFDELRCCLFFEQRRYHHFGEGPKGDDAKAILDLYQAICERWNFEVEYIPHRPLKDPREIKMLDPACGSMHFGLYAFDLFEQIYTEAWELEDRLGADALRRLADLEPLHKTYPDKETYLKDVPRLIIERNIHGVDIDPRAVQIAGLSLWLRAQKSWQAQGLRPGERPQIRKSNVVCAEPMPGDRQMLEEFLATLRGEGLEALMRKAWHVPADQKVRATPQMADALAKLVRTVWQEMELAGEAGSLLKIEETLRNAITTARKESEEKSPLFRVLEYGLSESTKEKYVQVVAGEDQEFFDRAEGLVLAALKDYAEQAVNGEGYQRRLFAGDAIQGFDFINGCRNRYDVILMNPPFGEFSERSKPIYKTNRIIDIYAAFIIRGLEFIKELGFLGVISNRTFLTLSGHQVVREMINSDINHIQLVADLGSNVLDSALVEAAASVINKGLNGYTSQIQFFPCYSYLDKESSLYSMIETGKDVIVRRSDYFDKLPSKPLAYWLPEKILELFVKNPSLETNHAKAWQGLITSDDFRFARLRWEIDANEISPQKRWVYFPKGGEFSPFYEDIHLVINWKNSGQEIVNFFDENGNLRSRPQSINHYYRKGLTYPWRTSLGFAPRVLPKNCIFAAQGSAILSLSEQEDSSENLLLLGILNSSLYQLLISIGVGAIENAAKSYQVGLVSSLPSISLSPETKHRISKLSLEIVTQLRILDSFDETAITFIGPIPVKYFDTKNRLVSLRNSMIEVLKNNIEKIDDEILRSIGIQKNEIPPYDLPVKYLSTKIDGIFDDISSLLSWTIGVIFGRWNVEKYSSENKELLITDPFTPLPACPPGMLTNIQGYPANSKEIPQDYPIRISWLGIISEDQGSRDDVESRCREILNIIWGNDVEVNEQKVCHILGVHSLREYYRKPALFFSDHLKRYSKSRRAAPIYWPLSTPSCSYTLWLYYHRLNDQTLYSCVNDFVDPKLKQVSEEASRLRLKKGRNAADEKELERLTDFERELKDFREELLRVAKFWKPNLNDGVEITAAPLWKLFQHKPWQKRLKETWQKMEAGEYDWAHLAYSIWPERVREKCKTDKSLAIAHDLEELYVEPPASTKKKKAKKPVVDEETEGWFNDD
ncbi:hypothetical protein hrd7_03980 [Leptolinea sp. HRD-7]|nr:hypothetical protein hrd7_03980 [Leptolinea sp. HRD-7]